ncbi:hypothetical protein BT69DRAFT_1350101 [Atractiella rhizophila]|nr:hypothetical protein BT69DRAFT_1350101 [Atractiella rhizophila]
MLLCYYYLGLFPLMAFAASNLLSLERSEVSNKGFSMLDSNTEPQIVLASNWDPEHFSIDEYFAALIKAYENETDGTVTNASFWDVLKSIFSSLPSHLKELHKFVTDTVSSIREIFELPAMEPIIEGLDDLPNSSSGDPVAQRFYSLANELKSIICDALEKRTDWKDLSASTIDALKKVYEEIQSLYTSHKLSDSPKPLRLFLGVTLVTSGFMILASPLFLWTLGFGTAGVTARSFAAAIQAMIGNVAKGSIFALFQSIGAAGLGSDTLLVARGMIRLGMIFLMSLKD